MKDRALTNKTIALENTRRRPFRTLGLILMVCFFSIVLLTGSLISLSLSNGVKSLSDRMGADVIVVPEGYKGNVESLLLTGEKNDFYMPSSNIDLLNDIEGIEVASPQLYIATLKASCCSFPVQIIGFDNDNDFIIKPWLKQSISQEIKDGEVILGAQVVGETGETVKFFDKSFIVKGRLEKTGMGFDTSVFMNMDTAKKLAVDAQRIKKHPVADNENLISSIMIKIKNGYEAKNVAAEITKKHVKDGMYGVYSKSFVSEISSNLRILSTYIGTTIFLVWIVAVIIIGTVFAVIVNERKKEMSILRVLGATKKKLVSIFLTESILISGFGTALGLFIGGILTAILLPLVSNTLNIPYLLPSFFNIIIYVLICLIIGIVIGPLSSIISASRATKEDIYTSLRGN